MTKQKYIDFGEYMRNMPENKPKKSKKPPYKKPQSLKDLEIADYNFRYQNSNIPENARSYNKYRDDNANQLTKAIIAYVKIQGGQAYRINSQGQYDPKLKRFRYSGTRKGLPDIHIVYKGKFIGVEVKIGRDRQSEHQKKVQSEIESSGGVYFLARNFDDFVDFFENLR